MPNSTFVMQVVHNDVAAERGEEYMLVPLAARDADPAFWGWPLHFSAPVQYDEPVVNVVDDGNLRIARLYYVGERSEFRLVTTLYAAGPAAAGGILEVVAAPRAGVDYEYRLHPPGSVRHGLLLPHASNPTHNSPKMWGYF